VPVDSGDATDSSNDGSCRASINYEVLPQRTTGVKLPEPLRGLFELRVARASQRSSLWVLIEEEKEYAAVQQAYTRFSASVTSARPTLSPEALQRLRRAYLAALSSNATTPSAAPRSR
jgi:hypothetical protein